MIYDLLDFNIPSTMQSHEDESHIQICLLQFKTQVTKWME